MFVFRPPSFIGEVYAKSLQDLVSRLTPGNAKVNIGVLEVAHSIFKRWRPLFASDDLYTEINHVLSKFGQAFVHLLGVGFALFSVDCLLSCIRAPISKSKRTRIIRRHYGSMLRS